MSITWLYDNRHTNDNAVVWDMDDGTTISQQQLTTLGLECMMSASSDM